MKKCAKCRKEYGDEFDACPHCAKKVKVAWTVAVGVVVGVVVLSLDWGAFMEGFRASAGEENLRNLADGSRMWALIALIALGLVFHRPIERAYKHLGQNAESIAVKIDGYVEYTRKRLGF